MKKEEERPSMEDAGNTKEPWWNTLAEGIRMPKDTMILAGRLKEARNRRKFVPSLLASLNGLSEARITAWEDGSELFPFEYLECMANSLNVSPVWLWLGNILEWEDSEETLKGPESFYAELFVNEDGIYVQFALEWYAKQAIQKLPETLDGEVKVVAKLLLKAFRYTTYRKRKNDREEDELLLKPYLPVEVMTQHDVASLADRVNTQVGHQMTDSLDLTMDEICNILSESEKQYTCWRLVNAYPDALIRRAFLMIKAIAIDGSAIAENETVMQAIGETVNKVTDVHGEFCVFTNTRNSEILTAVKKARMSSGRNREKGKRKVKP